jgi:hypothetical protein
MWGQKWGQMVWGVATAAPAIGFGGSMVLGALLLWFGQRFLARRERHRAIGIAALALAFVLPLGAALASIPFAFTNGTVADAVQVNTNFNALDGRVSTLEAFGPAVGIQRSSFSYTAVTSPAPSMTLPLSQGSYTLEAAGCGNPTGGTFLISATLRINGVDTDLAVLDGSTFDCFTFVSSVTVPGPSAGSAAVIFQNAGGTGGAQGNIRWSRIIATRVPSVSVTTVTN